MFNNLTVLLLPITLALSLLGCASPMTEQTTMEERDYSGRYDGLWGVEIHRSPGVQYLQNWQMSCANLEDETNLLIKNGKIMSVGGQDTSQTNTYISLNGKFRYIQPSSQTLRESGGSDATLDNGAVKIIFNGKLNQGKGKGFLTIGVAQFGYDGCKSKVTFTR